MNPNIDKNLDNIWPSSALISDDDFRKHCVIRMAGWCLLLQPQTFPPNMGEVKQTGKPFDLDAAYEKAKEILARNK